MTLLNSIPKVDKVLGWPGIKAIHGQCPRPLLLKAVRTVLAELRAEALCGDGSASGLSEQTVTGRILSAVAVARSFNLRKVVNGTGVVLHTNLGRSPLPESARQRLNDIVSGYTNLELDLQNGVRGSRYDHVEDILCELTGAEAALVVNNNAAAVLLALTSLASGKEVIVSRGELVEIGGSFRIPDLMRQSGAILREVGTTNRTHPGDYRNAVTVDTGLILKVHTSNFAIVGYTAEVSGQELVVIGKEFSLPVMVDAGSGNLVGIPDLPGFVEPTVRDLLREGPDILTFSGDKLLGGPQAGIIVGRRIFIDPLKKHPLLRAVRVDKLTLAALEATLHLYRDERQALQHVPTLRMLTVSPTELESRGKRLLRRLRKVLPTGVEVSLVAGFSQAGGGALPLLELPTTLLDVAHEGDSPQQLEKKLRGCKVPVLGRISKERYLLDLRTIPDEDVPHLVAALLSLADQN